MCCLLGLCRSDLSVLMNQIQKPSVLQPAVELLKIFNKEWEVIKAKYQFTSNLVEGFCKGFLLYYLPITLFKRKFTFTSFQRSLGIYCRFFQFRFLLI